ncbi:hypothetical protein DBR13_02070 [Aeromonas sp. HMWF015]|nr:hypothetical protein DBR13_02070 [Aeromonas sp. HMWF015]
MYEPHTATVFCFGYKAKFLNLKFRQLFHGNNYFTVLQIVSVFTSRMFNQQIIADLVDITLFNQFLNLTGLGQMAWITDRNEVITAAGVMVIRVK